MIQITFTEDAEAHSTAVEDFLAARKAVLDKARSRRRWGRDQLRVLAWEQEIMEHFARQIANGIHPVDAFEAATIRLISLLGRMSS